eukprot:3927721-Rhodomonas_salina.1
MLIGIQSGLKVVSAETVFVECSGASSSGVVAQVATVTSWMMAQPAEWATMLEMSRTLANQYRGVVSAAEALAEPDNTVLLLAQSEAMTAGDNTCSVRSATETFFDFTFVSVAAPSGQAVLLQANTPDNTLSSGLAGDVVVTIQLENFQIVYFATDVVVNFGGANMSCSLLRSDESITILTVTVPAGAPGDVAVRVFPSSRPSNWAEFTFTYEDDRLPILVSLAPVKMYNDGTQLITLTVDQFPGVTSTSDVTVTVGSDEATIDSVTADGEGTATITFMSTQGSVGTPVVTCTA